MKKTVYFIFTFSIVFWGCSAIQESETKNNDNTNNVYVFDDVSVKDSSNNMANEIVEDEITANKKFEMYIVQIGAFSTQEKAEIFLTSIKDKTDKDFNILYNSKSNLHVIQMAPFRSRNDAERVRDELRNIEELKGTFIVPNK